MKAFNRKRKPKHTAKNTTLEFFSIIIELPNFSIKKSYHDKKSKSNIVVTKYHKDSYHFFRGRAIHGR